MIGFLEYSGRKPAAVFRLFRFSAMDSSQVELSLHGLQVVQVSLAVLSGNDLNGSVDDFVNGLELDSLHGA